jgi:hypothetical protein
LLLAILAPALCIACSSGSDEPTVPDIEMATPDTVEPPPSKPWHDPQCAADKEGKFEQAGNRWTRFAGICRDQVVVHFDAFPDPGLSYWITDYRCDLDDEKRRAALNGGKYASWVPDEAFFRQPVAEQSETLRQHLTRDLAFVARQCGFPIDPAPFTGAEFERFYLGLGDGWWFSRDGNRTYLTPEKGESR